MKKQLSFLLLLITIEATAQNTGIGTTNPAEKLDVNGNINVRGNLKVNGNAGQPGQVLKVNNDGTQSWANVFGYKNRRAFFYSGSTVTWTVPNNVNEILVEAVGGGGGGAFGGGGGSGAFGIGIFKMAPGQVLNIIVGGGGNGALTESDPAGGGGVSDVSLFPKLIVSANGGEGAAKNQNGRGLNAVITGDSMIFQKQYSGNSGDLTTEDYVQRTSTEFVTIQKFGDGGTCAYNPEGKNKGSYLSFNTVTLANITLNYSSTVSGIFGAGGGGGVTVKRALGA